MADRPPGHISGSLPGLQFVSTCSTNHRVMTPPSPDDRGEVVTFLRLLADLPDILSETPPTCSSSDELEQNRSPAKTICVSPTTTTRSKATAGNCDQRVERRQVTQEFLHSTFRETGLQLRLSETNHKAEPRPRAADPRPCACAGSSALDRTRQKTNTLAREWRAKKRAMQRQRLRLMDILREENKTLRQEEARLKREIQKTKALLDEKKLRKLLQF